MEVSWEEEKGGFGFFFDMWREQLVEKMKDE